MRIKYYYIREEITNKPIITVCLLEAYNPWRVTRGVAICSPEENPEKKEGKKWARKRAIRALYQTGASDPLQRKETKDLILKLEKGLDTSKGVMYIPHLLQYDKMCYMPQLTPYEQRLLYL